MYMGYPDDLKSTLEKVAASRERRLSETPGRLSLDDKERLLHLYHPDYRPEAMTEIRVGVNKGDRAVKEFVAVLESYGQIDPERFKPLEPDLEADVLVVGGGGSGATTAYFAARGGARVVLATKLRFGDSNTIMAEGGIAAATHPKDSPCQHYVDSLVGGRFSNVPELVEALVLDAPIIIHWLKGLGVGFGLNPDGTFITHASGGHSWPRNHAWSDLTGLEVLRTIRDEVLRLGVTVLEFHPTVELILDEHGRCWGAVLKNLDTNKLVVIRARLVVLATGGMGRLHPQGFPTSNHYGATADGLVLAYRAGAKLVFMDAIQYHPTGTVWPEPAFGLLVSESTRANGAQLVNAHGERFIYELETRDAVASSIIRETRERGNGVRTSTNRVGVWLDLPTLEYIGGPGRVRSRFPHIHGRFMKYGIDVSKVPVLVYPTQHYQNGGILIDPQARTGVENLLMAGEAAGGVQGRNRLGSNSLTDIFVFGRRAGLYAAQACREARNGSPTFSHLRAYHSELRSLGIPPGRKAPILFPDYVRGDL
ncbi:MAG: FAD-binding protein [Deltaproteobacteria bacterium]|nr:FAD-binding protein [Deltaproteobacteria bacterium]